MHTRVTSRAWVTRQGYSVVVDLRPADQATLYQAEPASGLAWPRLNARVWLAQTLGPTDVPRSARCRLELHGRSRFSRGLGARHHNSVPALLAGDRGLVTNR